jgi:hypothetical protein
MRERVRQLVVYLRELNFECVARTLFALIAPVDIDGVDVLNEGITVGNGCESSLTSEGTENEGVREMVRSRILSFISQWDAPGMGSQWSQCGQQVRVIRHSQSCSSFDSINFVMTE